MYLPVVMLSIFILYVILICLSIQRNIVSVYEMYYYACRSWWRMGILFQVYQIQTRAISRDKWCFFSRADCTIDSWNLKCIQNWYFNWLQNILCFFSLFVHVTINIYLFLFFYSKWSSTYNWKKLWSFIVTIIYWKAWNRDIWFMYLIQ